MGGAPPAPAPAARRLLYHSSWPAPAPGVRREAPEGHRVHVEAFSRGKDRQDPSVNDDQLVVLPGVGYAVIDGISDIGERRYQGLPPGRLAARLAQQAVARFLLDPAEREADPSRLLQRISADLRAARQRHGLLDAAPDGPGHRFGATLTLAVDRGSSFRFILIGDSGLRLDGREVTVVDSGLDRVTSSLRQEAYRVVRAAGGDQEACRRGGRACAFYGAAALTPAMQPWLDRPALAALRQASLERCRRQAPGVPVADAEWLVDRGIAGQGRFQNNTESPLSYAVVDGFAVPLALVRVMDRPRAGLRSIELFTDGYPRPGADPELAAWEAAFAEVERLDPERIDRYPSVKGSTARAWADDRTVVIVRP
jgi:hypothetical protein